MIDMKHKETIENAIQANRERKFFAQYPEHPKAYGEESPANGLNDYKSQLGKPFDQLMQDAEEAWKGEEVSPYTGEALGITYPVFAVDSLIANAQASARSWKKAGIDTRCDLLIDALENIKNRFFEIAYATMHTTGQSFMMSFQASGPHANDRALEAIAMAYQEQTRFDNHVKWVKPMGKFEVVLEKTFNPIPKGINLVIGCSTFPTWNSVPGIFAGLATGNPVIVKPHPGSVYPIAVVVAEIQKVLANAGLDSNTVQLAADVSDQLITKDLAEHDAVKIIDYTGGSAFGDYVEGLKGKTVFTEKAGVNTVILDSVKDLNAVTQNLAFAVSLYSGQMCTAPQNFFIPASGVKEGENLIPYAEVVDRLTKAITGLVNHPKMGAGTLGAVQNELTVKRTADAKNIDGNVLVEAGSIENPDFQNARICTPTVVEIEADKNIFAKEWFGPVSLIIKTNDTAHSLELAAGLAYQKGALTCAAYTTDTDMEQSIYETMEDVFVPVSMNLTGFIWVNQHAAFSDFHGTGGNPAGTASFTDPNFVNRRFVWVGHRKVN
jgi:phenylacetic acid degradation protein paaN